MLYPLHLLAPDDAAGWRLVECAVRSWQRVALVPRQLCLFESVPCDGVRLHELASFARVQAMRLSPFRRTGASAIRRGGRLHLWLWDSEEVESLLGAAAPASTRLQAEPVYLPWPSAAEHSRRCTQAEERIELSGGAMVHAEVVAPRALDLTALAPRRVAHDWLGGSLDSSGASDAFSGMRQLFNRSGIAVAMAALGYLGWEAGSLYGAHQAAEQLDTQLAEHTTSRSRLSQLINSTRSDEAWVATYLQAAAQMDVPRALETLRPTMEAFGIVIRELDAGGDQLKLTFASAGGEMRLPELLGALRRLPGVQQASLQQQKDLAEATFILTMPGLVRPRVIDLTERTPDGSSR